MQGFDRRINAIKREKTKGKKIALYVVENLESAQFRYRCENLAKITDGSNWSVIYFLSSEVARIEELLEDIEIGVVGRQTAKNKKIIDFVRRAQETGKKVLFDLDDLVFDYRDLFSLMIAVNGKNIIAWYAYFLGVRRIAKEVDGFICTNDFLGKKLKRSFGEPYKVIPNSLNREQIEVSDKLIKKKRLAKRDRFVIGYFSGSPTHTRDFRLVESELVRFLETHEDVSLMIVGDMKLSARIQDLVKGKRVKVGKKVDYLELQKLISEVDVNLAPLVINDFTNCKSELKFFEAATVETTTIASPSYAFRRAIKNGENGLLAQPGEWYGRLEYLYEHPEDNKKIAKKAREYALKHYYGKEFLREVEEAYDYFAK